MKSAHFYILFLFHWGIAYSQPANDDCFNAIDLAVGGGGFALGTYSQTTSGIATATLQTGETFRAGFQNTNHSIWYKFTITASRRVNITITAIGGASTYSNLVSFALYAQGSCTPYPSSATIDQVLARDDTGPKDRNCLAAGTYYIQVACRTGFTDELRLSLDILQAPGNGNYDFGAGAYSFGTISQYAQFVDYTIDCQSVDSVAEQNCPALTAAGQNTSNYTQSTWHTFTTDNWVDYIGIFLEPAGFPPLTNAVVGYWLYEGDVSTGGALTLIDGCNVINYPTANSKEYICQLKTNTTYTVKLLFNRALVAKIRLNIIQLGDGATTAPVPLAPLMGTNYLGTIVPNAAGSPPITVIDNFACNALLTNPTNTCGAVNPPNTVNGIYDLTTWVSFHIPTYANVTIEANQPGLFNCSDVFIRLFADSITGNCNDVSLTSLFLAGNNGISYTCLPPGPYAVQFLGRSRIPNNVLDNCASNFGRPLEIKLTINQTPYTQYGLQAAGRYYRVNNLAPIAMNTTYNTPADYFGCDSTVRPLGAPAACNPNMTQTIYREVQIGATPGFIVISKMKTEDPPYVPTGIKYQFFKGDANAIAIANNTFTYATSISGLVNYSGCIDFSNLNSGVGKDAKFCVTQGTYTLASYGDLSTIGKFDNPSFYFNTTATIHNSPTNAENMDTLSDIVRVKYSGIDYFSCEDNALAIDGQGPCNGATKAIYREFYLANSAILRIGAATGSGVNLSLFYGRASVAGIPGLSSVNNVFTNFTCTQSSDPLSCDYLPAGWYTIVAYGAGPNFTNYPYPNIHGGQVGDSNSVFVQALVDSIPRYNRPYKACNRGIVDWGPNLGTVDYPDKDTTYLLCTEVFGCRLDTPFASHPIDSCTILDNRTAYYTFRITKPSFVIIDRIPSNINAKVFAFDVTTDSARMVIDPPIQPCLSSDGYLQLCNLQPGTYTLALLVTNANLKNNIRPRIYIDSAGISKFDHASSAYDFGSLIGDKEWYSGQGHLASTPGLAPSNDFFFCTTGAQATDPNPMNCFYQGHVSWGVNNRVYPLDTNYHQFENGDVLKPTRRNLWYTFVLNDIGRVDVKVNSKTPNKKRQYPFAVYRSDVNGSITFSQLVANGGIDSILGATGLTLIGKNEEVDPNFLCIYNNTISFANCDVNDTIRYFVIVDHLATANPNSQVDVAIRYDSVPLRYDHCYTANQINGLNEVAPPYTGVAPLPYGTYTGDPASLLCATVDLGDLSLGSCNGVPYQRTLWYKINVGVGGRIRIGLDVEGQTGIAFSSSSVRLFLDRDTAVNDCSGTGLQEMPLSARIDSPNTYGQGCILPGTYYILITGCSYLEELLTPIVILEQDLGDICSNPVPISINSIDTTSATVSINCHTMGQDYGENGSDITCLDGPAGYKSTWFKVDVTGNDKYNLSFNLSGTVLLGPVLYRVLYGSCGNMTTDISSCSSLANGFTIECLTAGSYYVQVFSPLAAVGDITLNVTSSLNPNSTCSPAKPNFSWFANCTSDTVRMLNISAGPNLTYIWDFGDGDSSTQTSPKHVYPSADTILVYNIGLTAIDTANATDSTLIKTIKIYPRMAGRLGNDTTLCHGDTLLLRPYVGSQFVWQDSSTAPSFAVTSAGLYIAKDSLGCSDTVMVTYLNGPIPQLVDVSFCVGDSAVLNAANAGSSYSWSTSDTTRTITVTTSGTYTVTISNASGCSTIDSTIVTQNALPNVTTNPDATICEGQTISLTANAAASYVWSNNATTDTLTVAPITTTVYVVTGTDTNGCSNTDSVVITVLDTSITNLYSAICLGDSIFAGGAWRQVAGQYMDRYAKVNGCDSIVITALTVLTSPFIVIDTAICFGESVFGGGSLQTAPGTYYDTLQTINGCDSFVTTTLSVDTLDSWTVTATPDTVCFGISATLVASGGNSYAWSTTATGSSINVTPNATTTYWVDIFLGACTQRDSVKVTVNQLPLIDITGDSIICPEDTATLTATAGTSYLWGGGQTTQTLMASLGGIYTVSVTDANNCVGAAQYTLANYPAVSFLPTVTTPKCFEGTDGAIALLNISGVGPFTFRWAHGANTSSIINLGAGMYSVQIIDANGCEQLLDINITQPDKLSINSYIAANVTCTGYRDGQINMEVVGGTGTYGYSIDGGSTFSPTPLFDALPEGYYNLYVKDQNGCADSITTPIFIEEPDPISVSAIPDSTYLIFGQSVALTTTVSSNAVPPYIYNWTPKDGLDCSDCPNPIALPLAPTNYVIEVTDDIGCIAQDMINVYVDVTRRILYVPNAFSPNNDGINDEFKVYALGVKDINIKVFDRWGELVFKTENINQGWDGTFSGKLMYPQVFVYSVEITFLDGYHKIAKGSITIIR